MSSQEKSPKNIESSDAKGIEQEGSENTTLTPSVARDVIGSSGHVPRLEEINPGALNEHTGSSGADADREAAKK